MRPRAIADATADTPQQAAGTPAPPDGRVMDDSDDEIRERLPSRSSTQVDDARQSQPRLIERLMRCDACSPMTVARRVASRADCRSVGRSRRAVAVAGAQAAQCSKPRQPRTAGAAPRRGSSATSPIQVTSAAASAAARGRGGDADAQLVVLAAGRGELGRRRARAPRRPPRRPARSAAPRASSASAHAARLGEAPRVGGQAVGEVEHRARAGRAPARGPRPAAAAGAGGARDQRAAVACARGPRARPGRRPRRRACPVTPTRSPGRAPSRPDQRPRASSAQPTTVTASVSAGPAARSPPAIVVPVARARAPRRPRCSASTSRRRAPAGATTREVGLAGRGAHRGEVGERAGQRAVADVLGARRGPRRKCVPSTITSTEVTATAPARTTAASSPSQRTTRDAGAALERAAIASISASSRSRRARLSAQRCR